MARGSGEKRSPVSDAGIHPVSALARLRETAGSLSNEQPMLRTLLRACGKQASFIYIILILVWAGGILSQEDAVWTTARIAFLIFQP